MCIRNRSRTINHAENLIDQGCHGVAILGSTGQAQLISLEEKIRPQIGEVISLSQLSLLPSKINQLLLSQNKFKEKIQSMQYFFSNSIKIPVKYCFQPL